MSPDAMVAHFVGASALILVAAHAAGWLARLLKQPYIVGQLTAGIALGPSLLGSLAPDVHRALFPEAIEPALTGFAQFSLVVFLFAVGYELDLKVLGARARTAVTVALATFVVPMAVGSGCALLFQDQLRALGMPDPDPSTVLFAGVALSITAVPVLTAIVRENGLAPTVPGIVAVSAAGLLDVIGWTVLAGALLNSGGGDESIGWRYRLVIAVVFVALMLVLARPLLRRVLWRTRMEPSLRLALLIGFALGSAWVTHSIGLHVIFGALLAGVVVPREKGGTLDPDLVRPLNDVGSLLLPFFFVVSGQSVALGSMGSTGWVTLAVVTVLAVVTKIGSGTAAARLGGLDRQDARTVGVLMSTRGLTELIALNAGFQAGLLSRPLYTVLVFMALCTTLFTQPLLLLVRRLDERERRRVPDPAPVPARVVVEPRQGDAAADVS
ncbi:integral membrane ion exchanger [Streptomyces lincolnensis]|uniref:Integral membrane ion exchanger n=1 Tax=Streptomyces lincolnensis TaxID=1915 RepID=A0A1B1MJ00_STRLN|nr:cation:proton antiporter [Streptomyces lincolnensis]ANS68578.1 integral membrane ion exchanger [Streptomyces lincolnensis]AXG53216.1 integral membrane ion exchanger [Streptomyces lincolnensis]QMV10197.1 integral membrane ion exchanger [Streptomyces lincolnensis]